MNTHLRIDGSLYRCFNEFQSQKAVYTVVLIASQRQKAVQTDVLMSFKTRRQFIQLYKQPHNPGRQLKQLYKQPFNARRQFNGIYGNLLKKKDLISYANQELKLIIHSITFNNGRPYKAYNQIRLTFLPNGHPDGIYG